MSQEKLGQPIWQTNTVQPIEETEEKVYLLGFMPAPEVNGLVLGELGESFDLDRVKKLWLPKSQKKTEIFQSDMQLLDDEKLKEAIKDFEPTYTNKIESIEARLAQIPFWKANKHSLKMVKIDELISFRAVSISTAPKI